MSHIRKPFLIGGGLPGRVAPLVLFMLYYSVAGSALALPGYGWNLQDDYPYVEDKLPEASISPAMVAQLDQVDATYDFPETYPDGSGLTAGQMQEISDIVAITYAIQRDPQTQELTGRAVVIDGESSPSVADLAQPASFNGDWVPDVNTIIDYYATASTSQQATVEQAYLDLVELYLNLNALPGGGASVPSIGNGYVWRYNTWKTLRMCHALPEEARNLLSLSVFFISKGGVLLDEETPYSSTDVYHNFYLTAFRALSRMDDHAFKWQLMNTVRLQLDKTILGYPEHPQSGLVTIDGGIIHHTGHHWAYASYSFGEMIGFPKELTQAGFSSRLTPAAIERCRQAAKAWTWNSTNGNFPVHYKLRPQLPSANISGGLEVGRCIEFLAGCAEYAAAYNGTLIEDDIEMAYPAIVKAGEGSELLPVEWRALALPKTFSTADEGHLLLSGHQSFNVMGAASQRRGHWMASLRGAHSYRRGGEAYDAMGLPDHHHLKSMRGSLMLITEGLDGRDPNSADSGYQYEGWDHNFYPNVTSRIEDLADHLYWRKPAYFDGGAQLTGGANLVDNGVWLYAPTDGSQRKSAFFFGNRITLVTSDITYPSNTADVVTGLIQQGLRDFANQPLVLDGTSRSEAGSWELSAGGNHSIYDGNGNGYYIHLGAPAITAERGQQAWTYGLAENYIGVGDMPAYTYSTDFVADVDAGKFLPTTNDYNKVYFNHGSSPTGQELVYTVLVQPGQGELETLATDMATPGNEPFTLETGNDRHLFHDKSSGTYAVALFTDDHTLNLGSLVSLGRAGAYIWKEAGDRIELSCSSSYMDDASPFVIELAGQWVLHKEVDTLDPVALFDGTNTIVTLPYRQFAAQRIVLYVGYETWREENFPTGGDDGETDDPDGDGRTNRDEFNAGTDPNNGNDFFQTGLAFSNGWKTVSFNTASNRFYNVDCSTNLVEGSWFPMLGNEPGTGGDLSATDTNDCPRAFYRIRVNRS